VVRWLRRGLRRGAARRRRFLFGVGGWCLRRGVWIDGLSLLLLGFEVVCGSRVVVRRGGWVGGRVCDIGAALIQLIRE
jgi:hypothetical protein